MELHPARDVDQGLETQGGTNAMLRSIKHALLLTAGVGALMTGNASYAQNDDTVTLQAVIITAERREEDIQKTAVSVSVRTGDQLQAEGRYTLAKILENIPGVSGGELTAPATSAGSGTDDPASGVVIRGIRSNSGSAGVVTSVAASAALYTDDVYNGIGGDYDIGRVEVLRGPQGTLYGRSAVAGAVGTYTTNPDLSKYGGFASVELGANDLGAGQVRHYSGGVNIPILTDKLAIRAAGNYLSNTNTFTNQLSAGTRREGRIKALYKPNENMSLLLGGALQENWSGQGGGAGRCDSNPNSGAVNPTNDPNLHPTAQGTYITGTGQTVQETTPGHYTIIKCAVDPSVVTDSGTNSYRQLWAKFDWNLGDFSVTYIPAFRNWHTKSLVNNATSTACQTYTRDQLFNTVPTSTNCFVQPITVAHDEFITHEVRFASNPDAKIQWQAGGMYYFNQVESVGDNEFIGSDGLPTYADTCHYSNIPTVPPGPNSNYNGPGNGTTCAFGGNTKYLLYYANHKKTSALGVFSEATYPITDALRVTGGLRYDYNKVVNREFYYAHGHAYCMGTDSNSLFVNLGSNNPLGQTCQAAPDSGVRIFRNITYKARAEYDLTPENLLYASISTGASPGDVALTSSSVGVAVNELKAETLTSYEIGSKNRFLDNTLQINGDVYYQDYGGFQRADILTQVSPDLLFTSIVVPVKFYGLELEVLYQITPKDQAGLTVGYVHGWYVDRNAVLFKNAQGQNVTDAGQFYYQTIENIVPLSVNFHYSHNFDLEDGSALSVTGTMKYTSSYRGANYTATGAGSISSTTTVANNATCQNGPYGTVLGANDRCGQTYQSGALNAQYAYAPSAVVFDANATWRSADGKYTINGYVNNVFNNRYKTGGGWSVNSTYGYFNPTATLANPRSWGLVASVNF
jgi:iron complex outermembrane receptor protein